MSTIISITELEETYKKDKSSVLVGGCFDIIHTAHIEFLKKAKMHGDRLIVLLESDESIKRRKGLNRPINKQELRAKILDHLGIIDQIITLPNLTSDEEYTIIVKKIKPDIIAITENDPIKKQKEYQASLIGAHVVEVMKRVKDVSTSNYLKDL